MEQKADDRSSEIHGDSTLSADGSGPISRSSVIHVVSIVAKFDQMKRDLVREIGFEGILDLPHITKVDRKFTLWLLTKLDPKTRSIIVNDHCIADVIDFEVTRILGIPCGSRDVCSLDVGDKKSKLEFIHHFFGDTEGDNNLLKVAENNVTATYDLPMIEKDQHTFKVSFVVWVMGHLLAPTKKHNVGSERFWGALLSPNEINQFNWAAYVIEELMTAARDVQNTIKQNKPVNTITGCSILLQVLYFESIHMGHLNRPRGIRPHIKAYDFKSLTMMIAADKVTSPSGSGNGTWGSILQRCPQVPNEALQITSHTPGPGSSSEPGKDKIVIESFGKYVRDKFGDKLSTPQAVALSWFHARCIHHQKKLMTSIQEDIVNLVDKLFAPPPASTPGIPPQSIEGKGKGARQVNSEPSNPLMYGRTIQKCKRPAESSGPISSRRAFKRHHSSSRQYELPETLLTGCVSASDEHQVVNEMSDSSYHSRTMSHNIGCDTDVPSFDLGIDLNTTAVKEHLITLTSLSLTQTDTEDGQQTSQNSGVGAGLHRDNVGVSSEVHLNDSMVEPELPDPCVNPSKDASTVNNATISTNAPICNTINTIFEDTCLGFSSPQSQLNAPSGTQPGLDNIRPPIFITPDHKIKALSTSPGTLSKILAEGDLVDRITHSEHSLNINIKPWDGDYSESPIMKRSIESPNMPSCSHVFNLSHRDPPQDIVDLFFDDVSLCSQPDLNRPWLAHTYPREIEIEGTWIQKAFIYDMPLSYDICDLAIRRFRQLDEMMYSDTTAFRWRHIVESEFAMFALADEPPYYRNSIVEQFIGPSLQYKIEDCRMIVVPAFVLLNWSCYFFDFKDKCVHVIDPLYKKELVEVFRKMHQPNVYKVAVSLATCFQMFFTNWQHKMQEWDLLFVEPSIADATPAETGLLTLMYIRQFDGSEIRLANREYFVQFKKVMLYELMCLSQNQAKAPLKLTITLDD